MFLQFWRMGLPTSVKPSKILLQVRLPTQVIITCSNVTLKPSTVVWLKGSLKIPESLN